MAPRPPAKPAKRRPSWLPSLKCGGLVGLPAVLARMERRRLALMQTIPAPEPKYTLDWLAGTTHGLVSVRTLRRHIRGGLPPPPQWLVEHIGLVCACDLYQLIGLRPVDD